jgi:hypothetical protein
VPEDDWTEKGLVGAKFVMVIDVPRPKVEVSEEGNHVELETGNRHAPYVAVAVLLCKLHV